MFESFDMVSLQEKTVSWFQTEILTADFAIQSVLVAVSLLIGLFTGNLVVSKLRKRIENYSIPYRFKQTLLNLSLLLRQSLALIVLLIGTLIAETGIVGTIDTALAEAVMALLLAWIVIRLFAQFIGNTLVRNLFASTIWIIAALSIMGILDETTAALDALGFSLGEFRLSALTVIKGLIALFMLLYAALFLSTLIERRIQTVGGLTISSKVLIGKIVRVVLVSSALLIGITSAGVDLSLFAVFGGAVGLGVGFGLQKGISNLFSGMLLLLDQSIKPGDVIELPGFDGESTFGWVEHMGARYTEIITRDNKSFLIPNEDFITKQVTNWSHGSTLIRLEVKFGVAYNSDPHKVKALAEQASAHAHERICKDPAPVCHLTEFGDSSLNFRLRFWIKDAEKGVTNMRGAVMLALWDAFKENGIQIPYPHREIYIHQTKDAA